MALRWTRDMETGFVPMDRDHREVVSGLQELLLALDQSDVAAVRASLRVAKARVVAHFAFEEQLMAEHRYQAAAEHREAHASFVRDVTRFEAEVVKKGLTEKFRLWAGGRLLLWFKFHITTHDMALARVLSPVGARPHRR
ncbi:MAG: hemerythrin family protein [Deltaproteobacteria bacterium]|nr:hemerythrin family protein [Deltaproteobacteria bacterium]